MAPKIYVVCKVANAFAVDTNEKAVIASIKGQILYLQQVERRPNSDTYLKEQGACHVDMDLIKTQCEDLLA